MSKFGKFAGFHNNHYISAYDTTTQNITAVGEAFIWKYNTTDISSGISIVDNTKITVSKEGVYNIQFSAQVINTNASNTDVYVWLKKNGVNVANSNTKYTLKGSSEASVIILNFVLRLAKDDFIEVAWSDSATVSLLYQGSSSSPDKPAIPSIVLTAWEVGAY